MALLGKNKWVRSGPEHYLEARVSFQHPVGDQGTKFNGAVIKIWYKEGVLDAVKSVDYIPMPTPPPLEPLRA